VGEEARTDRRRRGVVFALMVAGVLLALTNSNAQTELVRRRQSACDGTLSLPAAAYVLGFAGLLVGALALFLLVLWFHRSRQPIALVLFATAATAVVFELFAVVAAFQEGGPIESLCLG
jgi:hypothetical protein